MPFWKRIKQDWHIRLYMLLLALLLWVVVVMTRDYETTVNVPVVPVNVRSDKILVSDMPGQVPVRFSGQGKDLFLLSTFRPAQLELDLRTIEHEYAYPLDPEMVEIPNGVGVVPMYLPGVDTVRVLLEDRLLRRLPVVPNTEIRTRPGYILADSIQVTPDSVTVSGPASTVNRLTRVITEERVFVGLSDSFEEETPLVKPKNVQLSTTTVTLGVRIDRLGERTINRVTVEVRGNPQGRLVILEPSVIDVRVKGAASRLAGLTADSLTAWVSFTQWRSDTRAYPPRIELPTGVELIDTTPEEIRMRLEVDSWR